MHLVFLINRNFFQALTDRIRNDEKLSKLVKYLAWQECANEIGKTGGNKWIALNTFN